MEAVRGWPRAASWSLLCALWVLAGVRGQPVKPGYLSTIPIGYCRFSSLAGGSITDWTSNKATGVGLSGRSSAQSHVTPTDIAVQLLKKLSKSHASNSQPRIRKNEDDVIWLKTTSKKPQDELLDLKNVHFSQLFKRTSEADTLPSVLSTSAPNLFLISNSTTDDPEAPELATMDDYYEELTQMIKEFSLATQDADGAAPSTATPQPAENTVTVKVAATTPRPSPTDDHTEGPTTDPAGMWFGSSGGSSLGIRNVMTSSNVRQSTQTTVPSATSTERPQTTSTSPPSTTSTSESPIRSSGNENDEDLTPYIAFNIWSYEDGELRLSAVKKIPAQEVLGSEFYSKFTENQNEPVMVLSDSIMINGDGSSSIASLSPESVTKMITSTENPASANGSLPFDFTALVGDLGLTPSDQQLLERLLNSANAIPETLTTPIDNIFDFVSYIVDGPPTESSTIPHITEASQSSSTTSTAPPSTTLPTLQTTKILDTNNQKQPDAVIKNDSPPSTSGPTLSSVVITPEGLQIFNESQGLPAEQQVQQALSQLDNNGFIFNINQSSTDPHVMKISLLSDDGVPIDPSLLQNANLISIISNKPTIVNHNIYQIHQSDAGSSDPIRQASNSHEKLAPIPSTSTTMRAETSTNLGMEANSGSNPPRRKPSDVFPSFTPEEQLFFELERITSFNKILNGGVNLTSLRNVSALESLALKGIFDSKPELLQVAKKQSSLKEREPISMEANPVEMSDSASSVPESESNVHALQLDVLPLGISDDSISVGQMGVDKNADLMILESLLREQKLPKIVERAILLDIIAGKPVSECILTNIDKYWVEIEEHLKKVSPLEAGESPLAVIEDLEKKLAEESASTVLSNGTASSHTFITHVNVSDPPEETSDQAPATTPNLKNCFKDRACTFAFSIALAAGTTGALSVPFLTPVLGRSLKTSLVISKPQVPNELMTVEDAQKIIAAVTKYSQRNGKTLRGDHVNLRRYMSPFVSYLGHKVFPSMFGGINDL